MSEPFVGERNIRSFISWARTTHWTKLTRSDETSIKSEADLVEALERSYGWSDREAMDKLAKVAREWRSR